MLRFGCAWSGVLVESSALLSVKITLSGKPLSRRVMGWRLNADDHNLERVNGREVVEMDSVVE